MYNEELNNLYRSRNIVWAITFRRLRWTGHVAKIEDSSPLTILIVKPSGKRFSGRPRRRWGGGQY